MARLQDIHKYFSSSGIKALDGAAFETRDGEIHALIGENGAGKSTLMHIMAGFLRPDRGTIAVDGRERHFFSPSDAIAAGIGMVRQHPRLVDEFSVWENCALGRERAAGTAKLPWLSRRALRKETAALNERWAFALPLEKPASALTVNQRQKTAILALLRRGVSRLIFDEPTAVVSPAETESLFALFTALKNEGKSIILISHKLDETLRLADRVTVLRAGKTAAVLQAPFAGEKDLGEIIFGNSEGGSLPPAPNPSGFPLPPQRGAPPPATPPVHSARTAGERPGDSGRNALELIDFSVNVPGRPLIRGINLSVPRGGITGIAGVRDSGLETLELAVSGFLPSSGTLNVNGTALDGQFRGYRNNVRAFRNAGGAYLGTRETNIANAALTLRDIVSIHAHRRLQKHGFLDGRKLAEWSRRILKDAGLREEDNIPPSAFSGGQFQRIVLMRELAEKTPLLVLAEPGRGLDLRGRQRLAACIRERAREGTGVLIFSTDSEELLLVCDTFVVLRNGFLSAAIEPQLKK